MCGISWCWLSCLSHLVGTTVPGGVVDTKCDIFFDNFLLQSLGRYLCWWTIDPWGHHQTSRRCFVIDIVYYIYMYYYRNLEFPNHIAIIKSTVLLHQVYVTCWLSCLGIWFTNFQRLLYYVDFQWSGLECTCWRLF